MVGLLAGTGTGICNHPALVPRRPISVYPKLLAQLMDFRVPFVAGTIRGRQELEVDLLWFLLERCLGVDFHPWGMRNADESW
jgi:hypothetical protein